ncbi:hypothetical protein D3C73_915270 [compost metagenome]
MNSSATEVRITNLTVAVYSSIFASLIQSGDDFRQIELFTSRHEQLQFSLTGCLKARLCNRLRQTLTSQNTTHLLQSFLWN